VLTTRPQGGEQRYACKRVVLATGGTAKEKKLGIPGEELPHVSHFLTEPHDYFRRRLLVVGGKNSAIETALRCHNAGARVSLCHRRAQLEPRSVKYWLLPEVNGLIESGKIPGYFNRVPVEITPAHVRLRGCGEDACAGQEMDVEADAVLLMTGYVADMSLCRLAGVELTGPCEAPTFNPETMESNVLNVFLAGTVTGGTQERYTVFVENGHIHTDRIMAALTGAAPPPTPAPQKRPES
jgi:thioredoxin reductase (NADPH)